MCIRDSISPGTGAVGLVAVRYTQQAGARVCATAGRVEKRAYLQWIGVRMVSTSRDSTLAQAEVLSMLGNRSLEVVLQSVSGAGDRCWVAAMMEKGRFVQIGRGEIASREAMSPYAGIYTVLSLNSRFKQDSGAWLQALLAELSRGRARPLPLQVFDLRDSVHAFGMLQCSTHIGKVVVRVEAQAWAARNAFVAITGGMGGLGLVAARWLGRAGTRNLELLARSGVVGVGAGQHFAERGEGRMEFFFLFS
eukprot:TRINITY_DN25519_c0_g1_i1.p1 TRINITY_DN25519_c0_g1~~TRINITY_DN25519_c0_g1_i1.p1  ORF type:complete len:267 (-),score=27.98 TRINITY_DN25519_c0_g1_i1:60-809(-)